MISEHKLSTAYASFWQTALPFAENFTRRLNMETEAYAPPFVLSVPSNRASLMSEMSFRFLKPALTGELMLLDRPKVLEVAQSAWEYVSRFADSGDLAEPSEREVDEALGLCANLHRFFSEEGTRNTIHSPQFRGCGILDDCNGDVLSGSILYEIKNVDRAFRITDVRQLLVYCALNYASREHEIYTVGLVNGRSGRFYRIALDSLVLRLTGGTPPDLFDEIVRFISTEEASR